MPNPSIFFRLFIHYFFYSLQSIYWQWKCNSSCQKNVWTWILFEEGEGGIGKRGEGGRELLVFLTLLITRLDPCQKLSWYVHGNFNRVNTVMRCTLWILNWNGKHLNGKYSVSFIPSDGGHTMGQASYDIDQRLMYSCFITTKEKLVKLFFI